MTAFSISKTKGTGTSDIGNGISLQNEPNKDMFGNFYNEEAQCLKSNNIKPTSTRSSYSVIIIDTMTQICVPISFLALMIQYYFRLKK
jgi:hypothetical protein